MATTTLKDQLAAAVTEAVALRAAVPLECIAYSLLRQGPAPCSARSEEEYCLHHDLQAALQAVLVSVAEPSAATVGAALLAASEAQRRRCSGVDGLRAELERVEVERARLADRLGLLELQARQPTEDGPLREVQWQEYVKALEPVHPRTAADAAKKAAKRRNDASRRSAAVAAASGAGAISLLSSKGPVITEKELKASHDKIRNHFATRFTEVRRGFRLLDEDHSGRLDRDELKAVLMMFNLDIKAHLIDKIIDIADADGSGDIDYAEFAQYETAGPNPHLNRARTLTRTNTPPPPRPHPHPSPGS